MRLIDADALKENGTVIAIVNGEKMKGVPVKCIDNAPTVEVPENAVNCVLTMFGKCSYNETGCSDCEIKDKIRKALNERPQGEWKFIQGATTQGSLKCPFCDYRDYHNTNSNFCPNCGADMRG